jgi:DNA helicase-2/ATP-dependent DNA helicase PcrA
MSDTPSNEQMPWIDELNSAQREAALHVDGPLLVVAGAGSGKTRTLAYRVAALVARGVPPERILLLTFTRRAAQEMLTRAQNLLEHGAAFTGRVWGGTFHAIANRLLRLYARSAALSDDFTVMDRGDAEDLVNVIRHDMNLHGRDKRFPRKGTCVDIYSRRVNGGDPLPQVLERHFPWCLPWEHELRDIFREYVKRKQEQNVLDYDDLLLYWERLLTDDTLAEQIGGRFDHVLVDEYQDTNRVQAAILRGMRRQNHNIMVVGDDAQSIYSFRAATVRNMLDFPREFPGARQITLDQNYRSVNSILETTNRIIASSTERFTKDLWSERGTGQRPLLVTCNTEDEQDRYVVDRILEHYEQGVPLHKQAVLFRAGHLSDTLEIELTRRNIPYHKYGGLRFLEAAHVKDMLAFLRIVENPRDNLAWFRALQLLDGIGPGAASRAVQHVAEHRSDPRAIASFKAPAAAAEQARRFAELITDLVDMRDPGPAPEIERVRRFYDPLLEKLYENPKVRARDLESLEQIAGNYTSRRRFLADLQLDPPNSTSDLAGPPLKDEDWLVLSTIHSAKGCEWDAVYLIHAADGFLPSDMSTGSPEEIEEERRLTYVAMTRARDFLYVTWPLRYYHKRFALGDGHSYAQLSRFFTEDVLETMDLARPDQPRPAFEAPLPGRPLDIAGDLRGMWED